MRLAYVRAVERREDDRAQRKELMRIDRPRIDAPLKVVPVAVAQRRPAAVLGKDRIVEWKLPPELHDLPPVDACRDLTGGEQLLQPIVV